MIETDKLRNVGILGHGGVGKTSLGEAMLFAAGATQRHGKVADGTSVLDFEPEEIHRQISLSTAFHTLSWKKYNLYLIDTPGYATFLPDTLNSMRAIRGAVVLLSPSTGLRVETERLWQRANEQNVSRLIFVGKMEREKANVREGLNTIFSGLEAKWIELQLPVGAEEGFRGVVDLVTMKAFIFDGDSGKFKEADIPAELANDAKLARVQAMETVAESDDALLEKYLESQELTTDEFKRGIRSAVLKGKLSPVFYGSAFRQIGVAQLLDAIVEWNAQWLPRFAAAG